MLPRKHSLRIHDSEIVRPIRRSAAVFRKAKFRIAQEAQTFSEKRGKASPDVERSAKLEESSPASIIPSRTPRVLNTDASRIWDAAIAVVDGGDASRIDNSRKRFFAQSHNPAIAWL